MLYTREDLTRFSDTLKGGALRERRPRGPDTLSEHTRVVHSLSFRRLQGKMQLFPPSESPMLRNRLTHSVVVSDIAMRIASKLNAELSDEDQIDLSIVGTAALLHDVGHPPFGHTGEKILAARMKNFGSFEGNAQTIRIITRLENRVGKNSDFADPDTFSYQQDPRGLDLFYRTIAGTLKYNRCIPVNYDKDEIIKGYYEEDKPIIDRVNQAVFRHNEIRPNLRSLECQIMDIADDIAYCTHDFEDCMIAGLSSPIDLIALTDELAVPICSSISGALRKYGYKYMISKPETLSIYWKMFERIVKFNDLSNYNIDFNTDKSVYLAVTYQNSRKIAEDPARRRNFLENLIDKFINAIKVVRKGKTPVGIDIELADLLYIEALKNFNYYTIIRSPRLQWYNKYADRVLNEIFDALSNEYDALEKIIDDADDSFSSVLLSEHWRDYYEYYVREGKGTKFSNGGEELMYRKMRFICDFVSSLTDSQAIKLYSKIVATDQSTIFGMHDY